MSFIHKILELITGSSVPSFRSRRTPTERQLIEKENEIGRELFGPIPAGHRRDFFCLDERTWVWHEEWQDDNNKTQVATTRYEVQPNGILKVQSGRVYKYIEGQELKNLTIAIRMYYEKTMRQVYKLDPMTGQSIDVSPATIG